MNNLRPRKDLAEIFGHAPDDLSDKCRNLWKLNACPFTGRLCSKHNHDKSIIYGVCSVSTSYGDCIICPNRLYAKNMLTLRTVARDAFPDDKLLAFEEYVANKNNLKNAVAALGMHSGHEIGLKNLSMDWILAHIFNGELSAYTGVEVQSLDTTGNYRDCWEAYKNYAPGSVIPKSRHGLNWANVHKRLIPQIIRKSLVYSRSRLVESGLYFIVPDIVYKKFEEIIGSDIPLQSCKAPDVITVYAWGLGEKAREGEIRKLQLIRRLRFKIADFAERFVSGPNLPNAALLDEAVKKALGFN